MVVRKEGSGWTVRSKAGRVLGKHPSKAKADAQLRAIEASKQRRAKGR